MSDPHAPNVSDGDPSRRFVLAETPRDGSARLAPEDERHAARVLRMAAGDRLIGLDGAGTAWPLEVVAVGRRSLELVTDGDPVREPAPGEPGSPLPRVEIALSLPKGSRAEDCFSRLAQLGVASLTPLVTHRTPPHAREAGEARRTRLEKAGRESAKQCGRLWFPEVGPAMALEAWLEARGQTPRAWLDPRGSRTALQWDAPRSAHTLAVAIGPEGGFDPAEEEALDAAGCERLRLGGHVLRIETAAEAIMAVVATRALERG